MKETLPRCESRASQLRADSETNQAVGFAVWPKKKRKEKNTTNDKTRKIRNGQMVRQKVRFRRDQMEKKHGQPDAQAGFQATSQDYYSRFA
eukprot:scaffold447714_cov15-Prasinocladus_malaysianus.AAC.1